MSDAVAARIAALAPGFRPRVALLLGSGLGAFADEVKALATIPYAELPGFPQPGVGGHAGRLVLGHVGPTPVAVLQGRAHYYENAKTATSGWFARVIVADTVHHPLLVTIGEQNFYL